MGQHHEEDRLTKVDLSVVCELADALLEDEEEDEMTSPLSCLSTDSSFDGQPFVTVTDSSSDESDMEPIQFIPSRVPISHENAVRVCSSPEQSPAPSLDGPKFSNLIFATDSVDRKRRQLWTPERIESFVLEMESLLAWLRKEHLPLRDTERREETLRIPVGHLMPMC